MNTRREFLGWMAGAAAMAPRMWPLPREEWAAPEPASEGRRYNGWAERTLDVPEMLDHILLGCGDLERGIVFVEERTGVKAAFGGVHPGRGTQNALLSLGTRHYLEIIAPDPKQAGSSPTLDLQTDLARHHLRDLTEPRLVGWAEHQGDLDALAAEFAKAGTAAEGPTPGSRKRPDGKILEWKTLTLKDDAGGLLPFFIKWSTDSVHPSMDAPKGCAMKAFWVESPEPEKLAKRFAVIGVEVEVKAGEKARLRARIAGPKGQIEL